jgi:ribonucleoside-diphosphate reductase beta chain
MDVKEQLLEEQPNRFVLFPIKFQDIWKMYKNALASFWVVEEVDLSKDRFDELSPNEQHFIKNVLAFFAGSDGIVIENLLVNFSQEISIPEVRAFYTQQALIETIHSETYSLLIDTYIKNNAEKQMLFEAIQTIPSVGQKANWAIKWMANTNNISFAHRLVAFAIVEGVFFSGSFCAIFWLKDQGKMPGLTFSNELISRDEGLHTDFACLLYRKYITNKLSQDEINAIFIEAVNIEIGFITESLPCELLGMNSKLMVQYIKFVADRLMVQLGHQKIYNTTNPFSFMELISLNTKTNFFEKKVAEYAKAFIGNSTKDNTFGLDDAF